MAFGMSKQNMRLLVLLIGWFASSSFQNIWTKSVLKKFPHPQSLMLGQMGVLVIVLPLLMQAWQKRRHRITRQQFITGILPLALIKLLTSYSNFLTLMKVPVSYAHTIKALSPFFTVVLSRVVMGTSFSYRTYGTLSIIVAGVMMTSVTQGAGDFNLTGLIAGLFAGLLGSMQSIFSKKAMKGIDHLSLLLINTQVVLVVVVPVWFVHDGMPMLFGDQLSKFSTMELNGILVQLLGASLCNAMQTIMAFTFLSLVTPVSYSVANVSKRLVVILSSILWFGNFGTTSNMLGMAMALSGVMLYNKTKFDESFGKLKGSTLPTVYQSPWKRGSLTV